MKRTLLLILIFLPMLASAQNAVEIDGFYFNLNPDTQTAEVAYHYATKYSGDVIIPSSVTYEGVEYSVTGILPHAFYESTDLISVTIPNSVTSISEFAFDQCSGLTTIHFPNNLTSIGTLAFQGCTSLTAVNIPSSVTNIGESAFYMCYKLVKVEIHSNAIVSKDYDIESKGLSSFFWHIDEFVLGDEVTSIGNYAFAYYSGLTSVHIPNSVTKIGNHAFAGCRELTSINIPKNVTNIGEYAFAACSGLLSIQIENGNPMYDSRDNCNAFIRTADNTLLWGCQNTIIPNSVTGIGEQAFAGCDGLTSLTIPNGVSTIGDYTFDGCYALTSIIIPNSLTSIGFRAFRLCGSLKDLYCYAEQVPKTGDNVFEDSNYDATLHVPAASVSAYQATEPWKNFKEIVALGGETPPEDVDPDGNGLIDDVEISGIYYDLVIDSKEAIVKSNPNKYQGNVTIPATVDYGGTTYSVTSIGERTFYDCSALTSITIPEGITSIGNNTFAGCSGLTSITIPDGVTSIGESAFEGCSGLTSITIPNSVTTIGKYAIKCCSGLTSITIPNGVTSIDEATFYECSGLTSITIPGNVTTIGQWAFYGCSNLLDMFCYAENVPKTENNVFNRSNIANATLHVPAASMDAYKAVDPWKQFKVIMALDDDEMKIVKYDLEGIYYYLDTKAKTAEVTENPNEYQGDVTIPDVVKYNGITYSVTSIGFGIFWYCSGLTSITIPGSVTSIERGTFHGCSGLTSVTIGNGVTTIGVAAFSDCSSLTSVTIPSSVTTIGDYAFSGCKGLTSVTIPDGVTSIGDCTFGYCRSLTSITIPDGVTSIGESAFEGCSGLTSITIPNSVTTIGKYAIKCCSALTSITIPNGVTSIDEATFYECSGLTSITIPGNVTTIGQWAFYGCSNLLDMFCYAENVPKTGNNVFNMSNIANATLHVPAASMDAYKAVDPWKQFKEIVALPDHERKMLEQGKTWVYEYHDFDEEEEFDHDEEVFDVSYTIQGDTVIGGVSYVKLMRQQDGVSTYYAALREEGTAVFRVMAGKSNEYKSLEFDPTKLSSMPNIYCDYTEHKEVIKVNGREFVRHIYEAVDEPLIFPRLIAVEGVGFRTVGIFGVFQELPTCHCDYESFKACYEDGECIFTNEDFEYTDPQTNVAYRPFVEDGKGWKVGYGSDNPIQFVEYYYFDNDTIIDGKVCKQMMCQRYVSPDYPEYDAVSQQPSLRYVGAWYEEDKKVYFCNATDKQFKLMYDFSVDDNATLQIHGQFYVIGPKQSGGIKGFKGIYRDVMMPWDEEQSIYNTTWLEGVGGIEGPKFNVYLGKEYHGGAFLMSCTVGDEVIYLNDDYDDGATPDGARKRRFDFTHTIKIQPKARITRNRSGAESEESLYGEYNEQQLSLYLDPIDDTYLVSITSESGKPVYEKDINAGNIVGLNIDISSYSESRYTVTVENSRESFTGIFGAGNADVDGDGILTAKDIIAIINVISGKTTDEALKSAADVNGDGVVNIADIVKITNIMGQ